VLVGSNMRVHMSPWLAGVCALVASLGVAGLVGPPAAASAPHRPDRANVGNTHSPQLLRQLAGPAGTVRAARAISSSVIPGAEQGVDVASFQHPKKAAINWQEVAAAGIQFAAVKATEGDYYRNPYALTDLAAAKAAGLSTIAYAFAIPNGNGSNASPVTQANYLLNYLGTGDASVPVVLDIEYNPYGAECYGLSRSAMVAWIAAFDGEVQARTGRLPIIYTPAAWWHKCTGGSAAFGQTPMWVAGNTTAGSPALAAGWPNWAIWQYTSAGTVTGIDAAGTTDLDQLNPDLVALLDPGAQESAGGSPVAFGISQPDPVPGQTPSFSAAGLPPGLSISTGGQLTGWPSTPGDYRPVVTATDGTASGSVSFPWAVAVAPDQGPTGPVALDLGGKCLNDVGNRSANGTQADIWTCSGSAAQRWTSAPDGTLRIHRKCLAAPAGASDTTVELKPCTGAAAQQWWLTYPRSISASLGATPIALRNPASGRCLADPGRSKRNGARVVAGPCNGNKDQAWTLPAGPVSSQLPGMCMDDRGSAVANGTPVDMWSCNGGAAQQWTTRPDGTVRVHGKCLDVQDGGTASGTPVELWSCNGSGAQQWRLVPGGGGVSLVNPQSSLCLADPGNATADGTGLQIATCADPAGQTWRDQ
jgi:GH25 family lysozyme M1 (1,4-beta-N-acetylmuramidase)